MGAAQHVIPVNGGAKQGKIAHDLVDVALVARDLPCGKHHQIFFQYPDMGMLVKADPGQGAAGLSLAAAEQNQ